MRYAFVPPTVIFFTKTVGSPSVTGTDCPSFPQVHVPLSFFLEDPRIRTDRITIDQRRIYLPAYESEGFEIWGFTAGVLTEFLVRVLDAPIGRRDDIPVRALN